MASNQPHTKRDEGAPGTKDKAGQVKPEPANRPGTANKPAGKPAQKGPLERPETA